MFDAVLFFAVLVAVALLCSYFTPDDDFVRLAEHSFAKLIAKNKVNFTMAIIPTDGFERQAPSAGASYGFLLGRNIPLSSLMRLTGRKPSSALPKNFADVADSKLVDFVATDPSGRVVAAILTGAAREDFRSSVLSKAGCPVFRVVSPNHFKPCDLDRLLE